MTRIAALRLADFRSYPALDWPITARISVLVGPNGAGKTNLLEAISLLEPGRGLRGARLAEMARIGPDASGGFAIGARLIEDSEGATVFDLVTNYGVDDRERRRFSRDGAPISGQEAGANFCSVWLTPQMDRLFTEGAGIRRRFLDRLTLALEPDHAREVASFDAASANRNRLIEHGNFDPLWCTVIEESMARHAVALSASRLNLIERLNAVLADWDEAAFPASRLALECPIGAKLEGEPALAVEDWLRAAYAGAREQAYAPFSPQRADFLISDSRTGLSASLASTGQQRAMLVALVLAHAALIENWRGLVPVLLLDEPFVHLDEARREGLITHLRGVRNQVFCAVTETDGHAAFGDEAAFWRVAGRKIEPMP